MFYILIVSTILLVVLLLLIFSGKKGKKGKKVEKVEKYNSGEHVIAGNGDYSIKLSPLYLYFNK